MKAVHTFVACFLVVWYPAASKDCVMTNQCGCTFDDGSGTIDLSSIGVQGGTGSLISDQTGPDGYLYSYNPCYGFTEGTCNNAAACQYDQNNVIFYNIGDSSLVTFSYDGANVIATYVADDGQRSSKVTFICDENAKTPQTSVSGETSTGFYEFTVTTNVVCTDAPPPPPGSTTPHSGPHVKVTVSASISTGSVMVIIFFAVLVTYLVAGVAVNRFGRHRTGSEMVPNVTLWTAIPGLIKEGFSFTFGLCRRRGYDKV